MTVTETVNLLKKRLRILFTAMAMPSPLAADSAGEAQRKSQGEDEVNLTYRCLNAAVSRATPTKTMECF
jgi:hypothetical protein